eukprot:11728103-Prorocentrum_lima.AAC.1
MKPLRGPPLALPKVRTKVAAMSSTSLPACSSTGVSQATGSSLESRSAYNFRRSGSPRRRGSG